LGEEVTAGEDFTDHETRTGNADEGSQTSWLEGPFFNEREGMKRGGFERGWKRFSGGGQGGSGASFTARGAKKGK